jgi:hypothetical protein
LGNLSLGRRTSGCPQPYSFVRLRCISGRPEQVMEVAPERIASHAVCCAVEHGSHRSCRHSADLARAPGVPIAVIGGIPGPCCDAAGGVGHARPRIGARVGRGRASVEVGRGSRIARPGSRSQTAGGGLGSAAARNIRDEPGARWRSQHTRRWARRMVWKKRSGRTAALLMVRLAELSARRILPRTCSSPPANQSCRGRCCRCEGPLNLVPVHRRPRSVPPRVTNWTFPGASHGQNP